MAKKVDSPLAEAQYETSGLAQMKALRDERKKYRKGTLFWRILIPASAVISITSLIVGIGMSNDISTVVDYVKEQLEGQSKVSPGKTEAVRAVWQWTTRSQNQPFPDGVSDITWNSAAKVGEYTDTDGDGGQVELWSHQLSAIDNSDGSVVTLYQLVSVENDVPLAVGSPTIMGRSQTNSDNTSSQSNTSMKPPSGYMTFTAPSSLDRILTQWAKAYVSGDSSAFTTLVADPNTHHYYQSANLGKFYSENTNWSVSTKPAVKTSDSDKNVDPAPEYAAASITIGFTVSHETDEKDSSGNNVVKTSNCTTTLTVLVKNPVSGSAKVVAWGPDGDIAGLKAYSNWVDKSSLNDSSSSTDSDDLYDSDNGDSDSDSSSQSGGDSSSESNGSNATSNSDDSSDSSDNNDVDTEKYPSNADVDTNNQ